MQTATATSVLVVDDDPEARALIDEYLRRRGWSVRCVADAQEALAAVAAQRPDVLLTDLRMKGLTGVELCERVVATHPEVPVVVVTAFGSFEAAVAAMRVGACDFITKPFDLDQLEGALRRAARRDFTGPRGGARDPSAPAPGGLLGRSRVMQDLLARLALVASTDSTVLLYGETGTGKELVARALHDQGGRARGPFVAVNCAAIPDSLLENELFGHARGAFSGADAASQGLLVKASKGTLFLDEIGDMPLGVQAKLLRVLQERRVRPLGASQEVAFDARVIAATHRDLDAAVREGTFRQDLLYRLDVIRLEVPPLRARGDDVIELANAFAQRVGVTIGKRVAGIDDQALARLREYSWPGNVRELQNAIERAVVFAAGERLMLADLPQAVRASTPTPSTPAELATIDDVERRHIIEVLQAAEGNKTRAARILGIDRKTLLRKLARYGLKDELSPAEEGTP